MARERKKLWPENADELYRVACELAACSQLIGSGDTAPTAEQLVERARLADEAMAALREAVQRGHSDWKKIENEPSLAPLRSRSEFQELKAKLQRAK